MRIIKKRVPIYPVILRIVVTDNYKKAIKKLKIKCKGFDPDSCKAFVAENGNGRVTVFLRPNASHSIIAHEVVHIVNTIFSHVEIRPDLKNDEPQAYLTGWITEQIYKVIEKKKNENRSRINILGKI